jgi:hypothetical protein
MHLILTLLRIWQSFVNTLPSEITLLWWWKPANSLKTNHHYSVNIIINFIPRGQEMLTWDLYTSSGGMTSCGKTGR